MTAFKPLVSTEILCLTPEGISLFSKRNNEKWIAGGMPNSPLGVYLDVDLEIVHLNVTADPLWAQMLREKKVSRDELISAARRYNNVIKEFHMVVKVIKE